MSTESQINISSIFKNYLQRLLASNFLQQRRFITFLFFLILSATFWFIRSLSEEYETQIDYPVRYINFPENKILVGQVPYKLNLTVRANGFSILKSKLNLDLIPLRFNVSSFSLNSLGIDSFYVVTSTVEKVLSGELKDITILDISPDTLFFRFTGIAVKKVPVVPVMSMHDKFFRQQYMLNGIVEVSPDSIIISGPASVINPIKNVLTKTINHTNLSDTINQEINLETVELITYSQQQVNVLIPVDRFTEVEKQETIVPVNVPDSLNLIAIPGQVTMTYRICLSNYNRIVNNPIVPSVDYNDIKSSDQPRLYVFLTDTPAYISNIRFDPKFTEFLTTRK